MCRQSITAYLDAQQADHPLSAVVSVTREGEVVFSQAYGHADRDTRVANTRRTRFRIGSVTKQFTAYAALKTFEACGVNLDVKLATFFPQFPASDYITMRHLLQHTSGIPSDNVLPDYQKLLRGQVDVDELLARFAAMPLLFEPGTRFAYGNTGYVLLGRIIETLRGATLAKVFASLIFKPLGMDDTSFDPQPDHARGYRVEDGVITDVGNMSVSLFGAAGGLYATVDDLDRWSRALYGGACDRMFASWIDTGAAYRMGMGVVSETRGGRYLCYIGGGVPGFSAIAMHDMDGGAHVNIVSNLAHHDLDAIAFGVIAAAS